MLLTRQKVQKLVRNAEILILTEQGYSLRQIAEKSTYAITPEGVRQIQNRESLERILGTLKGEVEAAVKYQAELNTSVERVILLRTYGAK